MWTAPQQLNADDGRTGAGERAGFEIEGHLSPPGELSRYVTEERW
jgi:hypothetical protein